MFSWCRIHIRIYVATVGMAGSLSLAACSHAVTHSPPISSAAQLTEPEAAFMAAYGSLAEQGILDKALQVKIKRCMALHGFTYRLPKTSMAERNAKTKEDHWGGHFRLDLTNDDIAKSRREGYGLYRLTDEKAAPEDLNADYVNSLSPSKRRAWDKSMFGDGAVAEAMIPGVTRVAIPAKGCIGNAHMELYGDLQTYIRASGLVNGLGIPLKAQWNKDPQVLAGMEAWRQCMHSKGFSFKIWGDAWDAAAEIYRDKRVSHQRAHPEEIRIATADAECSVQTGKSRVERTRFAYYQWQLLKEWEPQISQYKQIREAALSNARMELSGHQE